MTTLTNDRVINTPKMGDEVEVVGTDDNALPMTSLGFVTAINEFTIEIDGSPWNWDDIEDIRFINYAR